MALFRRSFDRQGLSTTDEDVEYDMSDWPDALCMKLDNALRSRSVRFSWRGRSLFVSPFGEAEADALIDSMDEAYQVERATSASPQDALIAPARSGAMVHPRRTPRGQDDLAMQVRTSAVSPDGRDQTLGDPGVGRIPVDARSGMDVAHSVVNALEAHLKTVGINELPFKIDVAEQGNLGFVFDYHYVEMSVAAWPLGDASSPTAWHLLVGATALVTEFTADLFALIAHRWQPQLPFRAYVSLAGDGPLCFLKGSARLHASPDPTLDVQEQLLPVIGGIISLADAVLEEQGGVPWVSCREAGDTPMGELYIRPRNSEGGM